MPLSTQPYDPRHIAERAAAHAYERHVVREDRFSGRDDERYGRDLGIDSEDDLAARGEDVVRSPDTEVFQTHNNRDVYYNEDANVVLIANKDHPELSTCFRSKDGRAEFERLIEQEDRVRDALGLDEVEVTRGGYDALYRRAKEVELEPEQLESDALQPADREKEAVETAAASAESTGAEEPEPEKAQAADAIEAEHEPRSEREGASADDAVMELDRTTNTGAAEVEGARPRASSSILDIVDVAGETFEEVVGDTAHEVGVIASGGSGGSSSEDKAAYFARCVEDPQRHPPLDREMAKLADEWRGYERLQEAVRLRQGGSPLSEGDRERLVQERMDFYNDRQKSFAM